MGLGARSVEVPDHDGVDARIVFFDAGDEMVEQFQGADFPAADKLRQLRGGQKSRVHGCVPLL